MKILVAALLIVHGLITAAFSSGSFKPGDPVQNPAWLGGWPTHMGQSWLLPRPVVESAPVSILGGLLYLLGGITLIGAGLGLLGWIVPHAWWTSLALTGAGACLLMLLVYFHPFYLVGIASNLAVMASILWLHWPAFMELPA